MQISFRAARQSDFNYCSRLYFTEMDWIIRELHLNLATQRQRFPEQWNPAQTQIIISGDKEVGWLQVTELDDVLFLAQIFVERTFQRKGLGTEVMRRLIARAEDMRKAVTLEVVKINPAIRLYERLGFRVTGESDHKFCMRRETSPARTDEP
jgi:ribosomal protein S18 acetylase RimI-like enzyme